MLNQSAVYAAQVNWRGGWIVQNTINDGVFGWVNSTTTTLNTTLNNFYGEDVQDLVETVFRWNPRSSSPCKSLSSVSSEAKWMRYRERVDVLARQLARRHAAA
jgi:hypothetical protein